MGSYILLPHLHFHTSALDSDSFRGGTDTRIRSQGVQLSQLFLQLGGCDPISPKGINLFDFI